LIPDQGAQAKEGKGDGQKQKRTGLFSPGSATMSFMVAEIQGAPVHGEDYPVSANISIRW